MVPSQEHHWQLLQLMLHLCNSTWTNVCEECVGEMCVRNVWEKCAGEMCGRNVCDTLCWRHVCDMLGKAAWRFGEASEVCVCLSDTGQDAVVLLGDYESTIGAL